MHLGLRAYQLAAIRIEGRRVEQEAERGLAVAHLLKGQLVAEQRHIDREVLHRHAAIHRCRLAGGLKKLAPITFGWSLRHRLSLRKHVSDELDLGRTRRSVLHGRGQAAHLEICRGLLLSRRLRGQRLRRARLDGIVRAAILQLVATRDRNADAPQLAVVDLVGRAPAQRIVRPAELHRGVHRLVEAVRVVEGASAGLSRDLL